MSGQAQSRKGQLMADLEAVRRDILQAASALSVEQQDEVFLGTWSVKDLLAHLAGWDHANLEAAQAILAGRMPAFYAHHDRDWKTFNARLVVEYRRDDFAELVALVEDSHRQLSDFLQRIPAEDLVRDVGLRAGRYKVIIDRLLQVEVNDERKHCAQIQELSRR